MWSAPVVTTPPAAAVLVPADAKAHLRVEHDHEDSYIADVVASVAAHVESMCGIALTGRTVSAQCDSFADFRRLPLAPVSSIASIAYTDTEGQPQTLSTGVYVLRAAGVDAAIVLKYGQSWPSIQPGSQIAVSMVCGFASLPDDIRHALLVLIARAWRDREGDSQREEETYASMAAHALLSNWRR